MSRRLCAPVLAAVALALVPSAGHADAAPTANASTATVSVSVAPSALVSLPTSTLSALPTDVQGDLTAAQQPVTVQLDGAQTTATRSTTAADLTSAQSQASPLSIDVKALGAVLDQLHNALATLDGNISIPSLAATLADLGTITGNSTVMGLLGSLATQLTTLDTELATLNTDLGTVSSSVTTAVDDLQSTLTKQLGQQLQLLESAQAQLASGSNGQYQQFSAVTVPSAVTLPGDVPALPVVANLGAYDAAAVNATGATANNLSGPQGSGNESTTNLTVGPQVSLSTLQSAITALVNALTQATSTAQAVQALLTSAVETIIAQALPGGLDLSTLISQLQAAASPLDQLNSLVQALQLNSLIGCSDHGTGSCAVASVSVTPAGTGMHASATNKLVDLSVLPMGSELASALSRLGATAGTPLLEVQGLTSSADAVIGTSNDDSNAAGNFGSITVAGLPVVMGGQVNKAGLAPYVPALVLSSLPDSLSYGVVVPPIEISVPNVGTLTVDITTGTGQRTYTSATHRSASIALLQVRVLNGTTAGTNPVTTLGTTSAGPIATLNASSASAEVLAASTNPGEIVTQNLPTGAFGPWSLLAGGALVVAGGFLRRRSRKVRRG